MTPPLLHATVGEAEVWCSGRAHGNVGDHVGDDPAVVAHNRASVASAAGLPSPDAWIWVRQVHGVGVYDASAALTGPPPEADASVTAAHSFLPLAIVTADCAPVVISGGTAVGVAHAGHRGLADGILEATVERLRRFGATELRAFLGPCIHPARYEFGVDDLAALVGRFGPSIASTTETGAPALDIPAAVRIALGRVGVEQLDDCGVCTSTSHEYFSYRRDGATGRQVTVAVLR